jgi:hypothetical protein
MDYNYDILNKQNQLVSELYICQQNYNKCQNNILQHFLHIINKKTGLSFNCNFMNNYYIYKYDCHIIVFNSLTQIWGYICNDMIVIEAKHLSDIIYKFLLDTNRLSVVIYGDEDIDMNELTCLMKKSKINV